VPDLSRVNLNLTENPLSLAINERIERALPTELPRRYLGASILHECSRRTQFDQWCRPVLSAQTRSIFDRGHYLEKYSRDRLIAAGFVFAPSETLAFAVDLNGEFKGHADGVIIHAPAMPGAYLATPCIWEHKGFNNKNFRAVARDGLERTFIRYAAQIWLYQKHLNKLNPALFTCVNADTCEQLSFSFPYNHALADLWTERAADINAATRRGELLPRAYSDPQDWRCKICSHHVRCWGGGNASASS
jgi:hypothetical protein